MEHRQALGRRGMVGAVGFASGAALLAASAAQAQGTPDPSKPFYTAPDQALPFKPLRAAVVTDDGEPFVPERDHQRGRGSRHAPLGPAPAIVERAAAAVARQVGHDNRVMGCQDRSHVAPRQVSLRVAVQQQHGRPGSARDAGKLHLASLHIQAHESFEHLDPPAMTSRKRRNFAKL